MIITVKIKLVVSRSEQAIRFEECWITRDGLVQKIGRLQQIGFRIPAHKKISSSVEFEGGDVICGGLLNRSLFTCRKPGLQLAGDRGRNFTLNREYISKVALIS